MSAQWANGIEMVRAEKMVKHFGDLTVLNGIDLSVNRGQVVVIIGPSGSGKTTLLRCINHLEKIDSGIGGGPRSYHRPYPLPNWLCVSAL